MKRTKTILSFLLMAVLLVVVAACSQSDNEESNSEGSSSNEEVVELVFAHGYNDMDYRAEAYEKWVELVEELSEGSIKIQTHTNGSLVPLPEGYDAVSSGTVDLYATASVYMSPRVPELEVLDTPGSVDLTRWIEFNEAAAPLIDEILNNHNIKYLHNDYQGELAVITNKKDPVIERDDWKGLKLRDAGGALGKVIEKLGGSPVGIPLGELPTSISTGLVDGTAIGLSAIKSLKLYEMLDSISIHPTTQIAEGMLIMNLDKWNELSDAQQEAIIEAGKQAQPEYEKLGKQLYDEVLVEIEEEGLAVYTMSPEEEAVFKEQAEIVSQEIYEKVNEKGKELYDLMRDYQ